jgi:hypothetical protein
MNVSVKILFRMLAAAILLTISGNTLSSQNFYIMADLGGGQATGEYDHHKFAFTTEMGVGYETKSRIIILSGKLKTESYNFYEEIDLMVFSVPITCEIYPRFNPRPYAGISIIPGYATAWLVERDFFLSGGLSGGLIYEFPRLTCFAQYEYLVDLTGYSHNQTAVQDVDRYYLDRYYVSIGLKVRLQGG